MPDRVRFTIDGVAHTAAPGTTVAAALANAGLPARRSVSHMPRGALCGMGICHECRVTVDGRSHQRSCEVRVAEGMEVRTDG